MTLDARRIAWHDGLERAQQRGPALSAALADTLMRTSKPQMEWTPAFGWRSVAAPMKG